MLLLRLAAGKQTADAPALISSSQVDVKPKIKLESHVTHQTISRHQQRTPVITTTATATTTTATTTTTTAAAAIATTITTTTAILQHADKRAATAGQQQAKMTAGEGSGLGANIAAARLLDLGRKLIEASRGGKVEQVRHLVEEAGAPFTSDWLGTTALHVAAQSGFVEIAEILVRGGVNRDARTKLERTALHLAAQSGSLEIVDLLLNHGSDVNVRDMLRMTPLHWAVEKGHVFVAERLLLAGADVSSSNKFLLTPIDIARESGSFEMIELFKNWTSDINKDDPNSEMFAKNPTQILAMTNVGAGKDLLDIDYHLAFVDSATNSRGDSLLDNDEPCLDLIGLEWNKSDFDPDLLLSNESDDEPKVEYLMKVVEELQKENQQLRQKVEQLSTVEP